jgi:hypothetical protein
MTMLSTSDAAFGVQLPARVQTYIEALVQPCAQDRPSLVSVILFGNAFSKKLEYHAATVALYFMYYNFGRSTRRSV